MYPAPLRSATGAIRARRKGPRCKPPRNPARSTCDIQSMVLSSEAANASLQGGLPEPRLFDAGTPAQLMRGKPVAQPMRALSGRAAAWYAGLDILAPVPPRLRVVPDPRPRGKVRAAWRAGRAHEGGHARGGAAGADAGRLRRLRRGRESLRGQLAAVRRFHRRRPAAAGPRITGPSVAFALADVDGRSLHGPPDSASGDGPWPARDRAAPTAFQNETDVVSP